MDFEVGAQGPMKGTANTTTSLKRKSNVHSGVKPKKKKAKVNRSARLGYTVQEGEDMLLVIDNNYQYDNIWHPKKKRGKKRKIINGKAKAAQIKSKTTVLAKTKLKKNPLSKKVEEDNTLPCPEIGMDDRWGQSLPEEVLVNIFQMVVIQGGAVPFLCR